MVIGMKLISTGRINEAAAKVGEHAPMAATCCNTCRTCVQTNLIALGLAAIVGAGTWVSRIISRGSRKSVRRRRAAGRTDTGSVST